MTPRHVVSSLVAMLALAGALSAATLSAPPALYEGPAESRVAPAPVFDSQMLAAVPAPSLVSAREGALDRLQALAAHNAKGQLPLQIGFTRDLPAPVEMGAREAGPSSFSGSALTHQGPFEAWGTSVRVEESHRLRLRLDHVTLPQGATFLTWSEETAPIAFGLELLDDEGGLWTPSVNGPVVFLELRLSGGAFDPAAHGFEVTKVGEIVKLDSNFLPEGIENVPAGLGQCLVDANCIGTNTLSFINDYRTAIAHIEFVLGGSIASCTGGLVNDTDPTGFILYFLTANHCFATNSVAKSMQAFWDYKTKQCNGNPVNPGTLPVTNGATLLATSPATDFTLVRLDQAPPGARLFLGWNANPSAVPDGTTLYRISHPIPENFIYPQSFSTTTVRTSGVPTHPDVPRPFFLYQQAKSGGTFGGSSGSPVILGNGQIVGQLTGGVGPNPFDGCDPRNSEVDGAFSQTFPSVVAWLNPAQADTSPCVPGAETSCLLEGRFEVVVDWESASASGDAQVMKFSGMRAENTQSVFWWFFNEKNFEMGVKMVNACSPPFNSIWAFVSGLTDLGYTVRIRDTKTGLVKYYNNSVGSLAQTARDGFAFPCN